MCLTPPAAWPRGRGSQFYSRTRTSATVYWRMAAQGMIWIGTSGYVYRHWRKGVFYPTGLKTKEELTYYAAHFPTVELNNPFYRLPTREMFARWRSATPEGFEFAVKASRYITHIKRLRDSANEIELLMSRARQPGTLGSDCRKTRDRRAADCVGPGARCSGSPWGSLRRWPERTGKLRTGRSASITPPSSFGLSSGGCPA